MDDLTPTFDRCLVHLRTPDTLSPGGVHLPFPVEGRMRLAVVEAVGPEVREVEPAACVAFATHAGTDLGDDFWIVREADVEAVVLA